MIRVMHLIDTLRPGGAEQLVLTTIRHLDPARFQSMVAALSTPADLVPDIGIYDLHCQRKAVDIGMREYILTAASFAGEPARVSNPAGTIQPELERAVEQALKDGKGWVHIEGEDDLAGLVVMAHAPARSILLYGQPQKGVVWVEIDAKKKHEARELLEQVKKEQKA